MIPEARSPTALPVAAVPAGTVQVKVGIAVPLADVTFVTEHSEGALHVLPPKAVTSHTKRTRRPAGGVIVSAN